MYLLFENFEFFILESYDFFTFWVKDSLFGESGMAILKHLLFYVYLCSLFAFYLKSQFLVIFKTFINSRPKMAWHWVTYISIIQKVSTKFSKILCKDVKLMYEDVCHVLR